MCSKAETSPEKISTEVSWRGRGCADTAQGWLWQGSAGSGRDCAEQVPDNQKFNPGMAAGKGQQRAEKGKEPSNKSRQELTEPSGGGGRWVTPDQLEISGMKRERRMAEVSLHVGQQGMFQP